MLVRTFRLTDKLSNAFLRVAVWFGRALLDQMYQLRLALISSLEALFFGVRQLFQSSREVYETSEERRRAMMARRTAETSTRAVIREDPLKTQNRALSMFTVALMTALIFMIIWFTSSPPQTNTLKNPILGSGQVILPTRIGSSTVFPTIIPTATPIALGTDVRGSIVFSMRDNGRDNLWAIEFPQTIPIRLTNTAADDRDPVWSPDGSRIAFSSRRDGDWELYVLEVATGNTSRLTYGLGYDGMPTWSPDGKYIAYTSYEDKNMDIYILASDGSTQKPLRLTFNNAPDFAPAWSPDGRRIAYTSLRDGNQEIYIISLDDPREDKAVRLTKTPDIEEENPVWSPDGQFIAYSARVSGYDQVFTKVVSLPQSEATVIMQGRQPTWSPNGASLVATIDSGAGTTLISGQMGAVGVSSLAISLPKRVSNPRWTSSQLPIRLVSEKPLNSLSETPVYKEIIHAQAANPPIYKLAALSGIKAPNPYLSDAVDDSFISLRQAVVRQAGYDFFGNLKESLWSLDRIPDLGQTRRSWHFAGRAIDFDRNLVFGTPAPVEVVREDIGVNTYWRVYIRVPEELQGGQLGEPLRKLPWDFASRTSGDPQAFEQGGRKKSTVPSGYYVDLTQIIEDYGWVRIPAERTWRSVYSSILYWEFDKQEGLSWLDAMLQLYSKPELDTFLSGPTPLPPPPNLPTPTVERGPTRTSTPIPPDVKSSGG